MNGIRHIEPVPPVAATGLVARVYAQAERDFGLLPPVLLHSPDPPLLAGAWCVLRETLVVGSVPRVVKEALAAGVSRLNRCPYCVDAHSLMMAAADRPGEASAVAAGRYDGIADPALRRVLAWAGAHRSPGSAALADPPFPPAETAEMIGTAMAFHYINRMAHVLLPETPYPLPPGTRWAKGMLRRLVAGSFAPRLAGQRQQGDSLALLPEPEPRPADHPWAQGNPNVAGAFDRFAAAVHEAGAAALPEGVRSVVESRLEGWDGTDPGLGTAWLEEELAALPEGERPAGRLALLAAFASYRVDDAAIAAYRAGFPEDARLLGAASWASYVAARRIGRWLWDALPAGHRTLRTEKPAGTA
jgi:AhpD family alkylhydroperoxidase